MLQEYKHISSIFVMSTQEVFQNSRCFQGLRVCFEWWKHTFLLHTAIRSTKKTNKKKKEIIYISY